MLHGNGGYVVGVCVHSLCKGTVSHWVRVQPEGPPDSAPPCSWDQEQHQARGIRPKLGKMRLLSPVTGHTQPE